MKSLWIIYQISYLIFKSLNKLPSTPYGFNLNNGLWYHTLSKTFDMSRNTASVSSLQSSGDCISCTIERSWGIQSHLAWNLIGTQ